LAPPAPEIRQTIGGKDEAKERGAAAQRGAGVIRTGRVAAAVAVATAGVGVSVLVSGVGAHDVGGCSAVTTIERVVVTCYGAGGTVTVPGGTEVTVTLSGASGGAVGAAPGGRGGRIQARWTPPNDTVLRAVLGYQRRLPT
jgi:hypothetical protein